MQRFRALFSEVWIPDTFRAAREAALEVSPMLGAGILLAGTGVEGSGRAHFRRALRRGFTFFCILAFRGGLGLVARRRGLGYQDEAGAQ